MTLIEGTSINICLFPPQSINLISATTNSGKTYFITEILNNPHLFAVNQFPLDKDVPEQISAF